MTHEESNTGSLSSFTTGDIKRMFAAILTDESTLIRQCYEYGNRTEQEEVPPQPVRESARIVANDPSMNLLLAREAASRYRSNLIDGGFEDPSVELDELCNQYYALPLDEEVRITKVQTLYSLLKKDTSALSFETGRKPFPDKA